jgi:peptidoglycan/LPS O-acetylase OafA/YrhL
VVTSAAAPAQSPAARPKTSFRPEIQALRAIAVLGVVVYHLWPTALHGGFVGVDVFFVISGFLITQLLIDDVAKNGRVSLTQFWARRIRRILPAAFTVLLASIVLVVVAMPRVTWQTNLSDIRAAAAYFVNWQLGFHAIDYLSASNSPTVVQHYWSLAVEEQFYLLWPLLVIIAALAAHRTRSGRLKPWLVVVLGTASAASFITSVLWTASDPILAFFATPTRAWEFAVGGLIAVALPRLAARRGSALAVASWAGLALIAGSMLVITRHDQFPGAIALLPVVGAALVVGADLSRSGRGSPAWGANLPPVQWVGDNSYSIYLWHWPLIIAAPWVTHGPTTAGGKVVILVASFGLAGLTKRFVEDPVRRGRVWRVRRWPAYAIAVVGVVAVLGLSAIFTVQVNRQERAAAATAAAQSGAVVAAPNSTSCFGAAAMITRNHCSRPYARPKNLDTAFARNDGRRDPCLQSNYVPPNPVYCTFGQKRHPKQVIAVIGNSHAWRLIPALSLYAKQHHWEIIEISRINCLGLITTPTGVKGASPSCLQWSSNVEKHLLGMRRLTGVIFPSYVQWETFTTGNNPTPSQVAATRRQIVAMWGKYRDHGVRVFVVQDVPGMRPTKDPECIQNSRASYDPCAVPRHGLIRPTITTKLSKQRPSLGTYVPFDQYFCDATKCHGLIGGVVVYFDQQHITTTYARSLAEYLGSRIRKDFANP